MSLVKSKELFSKGTTFTFSQGAATLYVGGVLRSLQIQV